jgi:nicotinamide-nucleotide amidase
MNAEIIAIGSELLTPDRLDTNSLFLTGALNGLGIAVIRKAVVGDDRLQLRDAFRDALEHVNVVVACGGLGPTEDDLTREAVSELLGRRLLRNEAILLGLQERFRRMGRAMPEINARQAMVPEGATILPNSRGTAPGLWLEAKDRIIILLPGPPRELRAMFEQEVQPRLEKCSPETRLFSRHLRIVGLPESEVEQRVSSIYREYPDVEITILAVAGEIHLHPRVWSRSAEQANKMLDGMIERLNIALGENLYSTKGQSLEEVVAADLQLHRATIAVAESCTGGLLATRLTNIPGSSAYFRGGVVSYSNDLKTDWVDVPQNLIEAKGAVSSEVAIAMAEGIRRRAGSTLGIGVTGIAGPTGGTAEKPVGLVHISLAADGQATKERAFRFIPGDRDRIRLQASNAALDMVRQHFLYAIHSKA